MDSPALVTLLGDHDVFQGLEPDDLALISGWASDGCFAAGEHLFHRGAPADRLFLILEGEVALEADVPGRGHLVVETLGAGEVLGWSWLFPPYRWHFDARALRPTRVVVLDGERLRARCDEDPRLGSELMKRFADVMLQRLQATRMRILHPDADRAQS